MRTDVLPMHRNTIFVEQAEVLEHHQYESEQYILRVQAPKCARDAAPGQFAHLQCDPHVPMRRPLSIMRVSAAEGWVEFLYKVVGEGTRMLSQRQVGEALSLMGPIGRPFQLHSNRPRVLLLGGGVGIPPMVGLAELIATEAKSYKPMVLMGSEVPFPFDIQNDDRVLTGIPPEIDRVMPLLASWGVPSRLASLQASSGVYQGYITDLARTWLDHLSEPERLQVEIFACGPTPMLQAVAQLAQAYDLPCQVSLEEYMACAVGGCAGCVVQVETDAGPAMQRVCVDGPVFDAEQVFPPAA